MERARITHPRPFDAPHTPRHAVRSPLTRHAHSPRGAGFELVVRLPGNVGYMDVRSFQNPARFAAVLDDVVAGLADAESLVIDLRRHCGGSRAAGALLQAALFDCEPMHLDAAFWPAGSGARPLHLVRSTGARFVDRPVFVLVGPMTSAVARDVAAELERLGRAATVVEGKATVS